MGSMILHFNPSAAQTAATGVDHVTRANGIYTLHMVDGSARKARLRNPDDRDVMAIISAVNAEAGSSSEMPSATQTDCSLDRREALPVSGVAETVARSPATSAGTPADGQLALF